MIRAVGILRAARAEVIPQILELGQQLAAYPDEQSGCIADALTAAIARQNFDPAKVPFAR